MMNIFVHDVYSKLLVNPQLYSTSKARQTMKESNRLKF